MKLIGLGGRAGAGKTLIARHLVERYNFTRTAFADPLKKMLIDAGMCTWEECYVEKTAQSRWLMQKVGELFRKNAHTRYWVRKWEDEVCRLQDTSIGLIVADDIRHQNEAQTIRIMGGTLIMVQRNNHVDANAGLEHESESMVEAVECDYIFMADSGETDKLRWLMDEVMGACQ